MANPTFRNPLLANVKDYPYKLGDGKKPGPRQDDIRAIQAVMAKYGYPCPGAASPGGEPYLPSRYTGVFDWQMEGAVKRFQRAYEYPSNGVADLDTLRLLDDRATPTAMVFWVPVGTPP